MTMYRENQMGIYKAKRHTIKHKNNNIYIKEVI